MLLYQNAISNYNTFVFTIKNTIAPFLLIGLRVWVAWVFFRSGLTKISSWDSTLYLFEFEYQVPLLPWKMAAYLGTMTELIVPVLLAIGLLSRLNALVLFFFNIVAVISYPTLWSTGFYDHQLWGLMLLVVFIWGAGRFSLDSYLRKKLHIK